jgi:GAF domain-containing protein
VVTSHDDLADSSSHEWHLAQLLAVTGELAGATTREAIARIAIDQGLAAVGAAYGGLWLVDEARRGLELVRISALPKGDPERWRTLPLDADAPVASAAREGQPLFIESLADYRAQFPSSFARITDSIDSPDVAYAMLPIAADGAPFGVFAATFRTNRSLAGSARA